MYTFWNTMGKLARWIGRRFEWLHLELYGLSGNFDARADSYVIQLRGRNPE